MSAEVIQTYTAYCDECDWESDAYDSKWEADNEAEKHDDEYHLYDEDGEEVDDPRAVWLDHMDELVEQIRGRA